ncbi:hypothetical protein B0H19DRAFT_1057131 [Mycena capillaripes]|nr:hypothetical protein B0H19DRAFT_1057131 [Mycena capillaripes]
MSATILMLACAVSGNVPAVPPPIRRVLFTHQVHALVRVHIFQPPHSRVPCRGLRAHQVQVRSELAARGPYSATGIAFGSSSAGCPCPIRLLKMREEPPVVAGPEVQCDRAAKLWLFFVGESEGTDAGNLSGARQDCAREASPRIGRDVSDRAQTAEDLKEK